MKDLRADTRWRECPTRTRAAFPLGDGHSANRVVLLKDENLQPSPGQITGAGQAVVSRADDNGIVRMRHGQDATTM